MRWSTRPLSFRLGVVAAGVLFLLVLALSVMDRNLLKHPIERAASVRFGRMVAISGPLRVHLWSRTPSVTLEGLTIGNPPWEADRPMVQVDRLQIQVEAAQLLTGHLVLRHVELTRPQVYLHQEKSGRANWTFENNAPTNAPATKPIKLPTIKDLIIDSGSVMLLDELRRLKVKGTVEAHEQATRGDTRPFRIEGQGTINHEPFKLTIAGGPLLSLSPEHPYSFKLVMRAGQTDISADGEVLKPFDLAGLDLRVFASGQDLAELYYLTQIALPNSPPFQLRGHVVRNGLHFAVSEVVGKLGSSDLSGNVDIDASRKRPAVRAELVSHHLLLKDMIAVTGSRARAGGTLDARPAAQPVPRPAASAQLFPDAHLQTERMRAMDADVHFRATSIEAGTVPFTQVAAHVKLRDGVLQVEPFEFDMPQGKFAGSARIDAHTRTPKVLLDLRGKDIELAQFKGKGPGAQPPLDGIMQLRALIQGSGDSIHNFVADADGTLTIIVPSGDVRAAFAELTGINVAEGMGLLLTKANERTQLRCGVAQFLVKTGTAHAENIVFDTPNVLITGGGQIDLGPERLDLTVQGKPKKLRLVRLRTPVEIKGTLLKPSVRLEAGHVLKQGGVAAALGAVLTPLAAVLAFVDPGLAKDQNCAQLQAQAPATAANRTEH